MIDQMIKNMLVRMSRSQIAWLLTCSMVAMGVCLGAIGGLLIGYFVAPAQAIIFHPHGISILSALLGTTGLGAVIGGLYFLWYIRKLKLPV